MKIILVATDARSRNLVFVADTLRAYSLDEAVPLAKAGKFADVYTVRRNSGTYLRTKPNVPKKEQLDQISISPYRLFSALDNIEHALSTPAFVDYWQRYQSRLHKNEPYIVVKGYPRITKKAVRDKLQPQKKSVHSAAGNFDVDPYLLGAIIIDEIARFAPFEPVTDPLSGYFVGVNTLAGIAQVEIDTAQDLIKKGYYNPDPDKLSPATIHKVSRRELYKYVKKPKHSIYFAAARMRALTDEWKRFVDLSQRSEIIATLYHLPYRRPHADPHPNDRGLQIIKEFYPLAKKWLR